MEIIDTTKKQRKESEVIEVLLAKTDLTNSKPTLNK